MRNPVARIARVGVASIAIVGNMWVADKIIARQRATTQVGMVSNAGVNVGNDDVSSVGRNVPRCRRINAVGFKIVPLVG